MKIKVAINITLLCVFLVLFVSPIKLGSADFEQGNIEVRKHQYLSVEDVENTFSIQYTSFNVPQINSSFKTYMDYRTITDKNSSQYKFLQEWTWVDEQGFMRCDGERSIGINDDYYLIALGSYYGTRIGTKYRITLNTGRVFYGVLGDCKDNRHTDSTNQYVPQNKNIVEFIVDTSRLDWNIKYHGSANVYMPLNGSVAKIERIDFVEE